MAHEIIRLLFCQMYQLHESAFATAIKRTENDNAHVGALGPEQGPQAMLPEQGVSACMHLRVAAQRARSVVGDILIMYAASEAQGQ